MKKINMKLLILTQKVDKNDDVLGFFHNWIIELAKHCESVVVICLMMGEYDLPHNVKVLSLGKEDGRSKIKYIHRFYKYIWRGRGDYDIVFVHMNIEYVLLGGWLWSLMGKSIFLWYNHLLGNKKALIARIFPKKIFATSRFSFFANSSKTVFMPIGVDTDNFKRDDKISRRRNSIMYLGRISGIKNIDTIIDAMVKLDNLGVDFTLELVGEGVEGEEDYYEGILRKTGHLREKGKISFTGKVRNSDTPQFYNRNTVIINATGTGSMDKVIVEAMACECLALISNKSFSGQVDDFYIYEGVDDLVNKLLTIFKMSDREIIGRGNELRQYAVENHSLKELVNKFFMTIYENEK